MTDRLIMPVFYPDPSCEFAIFLSFLRYRLSAIGSSSPVYTGFMLGLGWEDSLQ